jgi:hypothetical protein
MLANALAFPLDRVSTFYRSQLQQRQQASSWIEALGIDIGAHIPTPRIEVKEEAVTARLGDVKG